MRVTAGNLIDRFGAGKPKFALPVHDFLPESIVEHYYVQEWYQDVSLHVFSIRVDGINAQR